MGRPRKKIDPELVQRLASIQCSYAEIAFAVGCNESTLTRRYAQAIKKGREHGKTSLRKAMWKKAINEGHPTMQIWLSKQYLGMQEQIVDDQKPMNYVVPESMRKD